jgi:2-haloacid dehalogenase
MKNSPLKAFVFDAYGTLFDVLSVTALCEDLFPGHGKQLANLWRKKQLEYTWLRSLMGIYRGFWDVTSDALSYSARSLNLGMTEETRVQLMNSYLRLTAFPDVRPGLAKLKEIGLRVAILSNGEPGMLASTVENAGLSDLIDTVLSADTAKLYKPAPAVYDQMASDLKIPKSEIRFVSANDWDVQGAGSAGFTTIRIQRPGFDTHEELGFPAQFHVNAITDLPNAISQRT